MAIPNPALGINANFDADRFRNAIKATMQIGKNPDPARQPIFVRRSTTRTYWKDGVQLSQVPRTDREGKPLDPDIEVRRGEDQQISVDCAIEVTQVPAQELPVGNFKPTKLTVTLLDLDYVKVQGCKELIYNGDRFSYSDEPESDGLFSAAVYTLIYYAIDES